MIHKLQNLLRYERNVLQIREYLQTGERPTNRKLRTILEDFEVRDGDKLVYKPKELVVVESPEQADDLIKRMYDDYSTSAGLGVTKFYEHLADSYLGITRDRVRTFLQQQKAFQLTRPYKKKINRPVLSKHVDYLWSMDLIDMARFSWHNNGNRYILVVVDVFSRYVYTAALKRKEAGLVADALSDMISDEHKPKHLLSDNGGEFMAEVKELCKELGIKRRFSRSYSPESNGLVEGINKIIRNKLNDAMVRYNTTQWVKYLPPATESWNLTKHGGMAQSPNFLYLSNDDDVEEERAEAKQTLETKAQKAVARNRNKKLAVNDHVRVSLTTMDSDLRKDLKTRGVSNSKWHPKRWSEEVYRIKTASDGSTLTKPVYTLKKLDGTAAFRQKNKQFFANQLLKVPAPPPDEEEEDDSDDEEEEEEQRPPTPPRAPARRARQPQPAPAAPRPQRQRRAPQRPMDDQFVY